MVDKKYLFRLALNQSRYTLPMARSQYKRLENQQVQRALQQGDAIVVTLLGSHPNQILLPFGSDVNPKEDSCEKTRTLANLRSLPIVLPALIKRSCGAITFAS